MSITQFPLLFQKKTQKSKMITSKNKKPKGNIFATLGMAAPTVTVKSSAPTDDTLATVETVDKVTLPPVSYQTATTPAPPEIAVEKVVEVVTAQSVSEVSDVSSSIQSQLNPYRFAVTEEKGKKAMVRFRENLRNLYTNCNLNDALWMRDNPMLEIYCYDPNTKIGYCRLISSKHDGPLFESPQQLYETYNCSSQGNCIDVFSYCCEGDEDHGMELTKFLQDIEILRLDQYAEEYQQLFRDLVSRNPLIAAYPTALTQKRSSRKSKPDSTSAETPEAQLIQPAAQPIQYEPAQHASGTTTTTTTATLAPDSVQTTDTPIENASPPGVPAAAVKKKRAGRPKRAKEPEATPTDANPIITDATTLPEDDNPAPAKKSRVKKIATLPAETVDNNTIVPENLMPVGLLNLDVDETNVENSTAVFSYRGQDVRLGDLPINSVERATMSWYTLAHFLSTRTTPLQFPPGMTVDDLLKLAANCK